MADATRATGIVSAAEKEDNPDMQVFIVVSATIKDSTDAYCAGGGEALLAKKLAQHYYDLGLIKPVMPEFGALETKDEPVAAKPADGASAKDEPVAAKPADGASAKAAVAASADKSKAV